MTEPFAALADVVVATSAAVHVDTVAATTGTQNNTPGTRIASGRCLNKTYLVELRGIEPLTFSMRTRRATNCATAPWSCS